MSTLTPAPAPESAAAKPKKPKDARPGKGREVERDGAGNRLLPLLDEADRHLVRRFSYGITPQLAADVRRAGGAQAWFERQLTGKGGDAKADKLLSWWPSLRRKPSDLWQRQITGVEGGWEVMNSYAAWSLARRILTRRPVEEIMGEFWENHLHVPALGDPQFVHRYDYGRTIRRHALGRFEDMLVDAITHPAMLIYLDNAVSTHLHPNENLGRELLELHTVGVGNFTDKDVRDSARILTGWSVDLWESWRPVYNREDHHTGRVKVKGFTDKNRDPDGKRTTRAYLRYLAQHPDTAEHLARKLAIKFVDDDPAPGLVKHLARVYLANDTQIKPVLRALVESKEFRRAAGKKVRDPGEDVVATYRALGARVYAPPSSEEAYNASAVAALPGQAGSIGQTPFAWGQPDGQPIESIAWSSPARLIASMSLHLNMAGGWWPRTGIGYREPTKWLPGKEVRFSDLVEHLSREILHESASKALLDACCLATGLKRRELITRDHDLVEWNFPRLLVTVLDSPAHLSR